MQVEDNGSGALLRRCSGRKRQKLRDTPEEPQLDSGHISNAEGKGVEKRHTCNVCAVAFAKPAHLLQHMIVHTGERPFICTHEGCTGTFKRQDHLTRHLKAHSGEALSCPIEGCPITCSLPDNLRAHVKRHEKTASINCAEQGCTYKTAFKSQLWEHMRTVHQKRHVCQEEGCSKRFHFKSQLSAHTAAVHGFKADQVPAPPRGLDGAAHTFFRVPAEERATEICVNDSGEACSWVENSAGDKAATGTIRWICIIPGCPASFEAKQSLKHHLTVAHLCEKVYFCHDFACCSSFPSEQARSRHAAAMHSPQVPRGTQAPMAIAIEQTQGRSILEQAVFQDSSFSQ